MPSAKGIKAQRTPRTQREEKKGEEKGKGKREKVTDN
jgi:hypothetical protein